MACSYPSINLELSKAAPLTPAMGGKKKPILMENPAALLSYPYQYDPRDMVVSCMSALIGIQPVGAFSYSVPWSGGSANSLGHRKAAFLALGGFCSLVKPLMGLNSRYIADIWTTYSKKFGIDQFTDAEVRELIDTVMKFQDYVNKSPTFTKAWITTYEQRLLVPNRKGCPDLEAFIDEIYKNCATSVN